VHIAPKPERINYGDYLPPLLTRPLPDEAIPRRDRRRDRKPLRAVAVGKGSEPSALRIREIELINTHRGGTPDGKSRRLTLFHYFAACRKWYRMLHPDAPPKDAAIWASGQVTNLNQTFRPPLPTSKVTDAMNQRKVGFQRSNTRNAIVARDLKVTPEEVDTIGLRSVVPSDIAEQRKARASEQKTESATLKAAEQTAIDALIAGGESDASIAKKLGTDRQKVWYRRQRLDRLEKEKNLQLPFSPAQP
jgi:hypothetical protein